ncbi:MAG: hypothetical protein SwBeaMacB_18540 [Shewanella algae]|uniref:hypothetical protein n=1 Tax=Shewanella algae TaxID=38313 RepID=UPI0027285F07|nr:hypothetical protein [Shewanella algae]MDO8255246.1 hypothetical protein [Shewanella algae]
MRFLLLIVVLLNQFACVAIESKSTSDFFTPLIFSCLNAYAASGDGKDIEEVDRVYVVYVDSDEFVDVFFSHGDTGSFEDRKDDYKGILSCSGVLDDGFNIYRLRNPHMSEYFIDTRGVVMVSSMLTLVESLRSACIFLSLEKYSTKVRKFLIAIEK